MTSGMPWSCSRTYPLTVEDAFDRLLVLPLPDLFAAWYGPIPPIRATVQDGPWGRVGQQRTVVFAGPGQVHETLTHLDAPRSFGYRLTDPTGPLALVLSGVDGVWRVEPAGTGSRITWQWDVRPRGRTGRLAVPMLHTLWNGYARAALDRLDRLLLAD